MANYPGARFLTSADHASQFVADDGAEVAFAGRSNAGKSSAINAIVNRRQFARVGKTPGRTQLINFFELTPGRRLVDLPGYGFARVARQQRDHWGRLMDSYFSDRRSLAGVVLIVDIRRGLGDFDRQMLALTESIGCAVHVLLTKSDKLKRGRAASELLGARAELGDTASVQTFSATARQGLDEARARLEALLEPA